MPVNMSLVPDILIDIMKDFAKQVVKKKPRNVLQFAVEHFQKLIVERDDKLHKGYEKFEILEQHFTDNAKFQLRVQFYDQTNCNGHPSVSKKIIGVVENKRTHSECIESYLPKEQPEAKALESLNDIKKKTASNCMHEEDTKSSKRKKLQISSNNSLICGDSFVEQPHEAGAESENIFDSNSAQEESNAISPKSPENECVTLTTDIERSWYRGDNEIGSGGVANAIQGDFSLESQKCKAINTYQVDKNCKKDSQIEIEHRLVTNNSPQIIDTPRMYSYPVQNGSINEQNLKESPKSKTQVSSEINDCLVGSEPIVLKIDVNAHGSVNTCATGVKDDLFHNETLYYNNINIEKAVIAQMTCENTSRYRVNLNEYEAMKILPVGEENVMDEESLIKTDTSNFDDNAGQIEQFSKILSKELQECKGDIIASVPVVELESSIYSLKWNSEHVIDRKTIKEGSHTDNFFDDKKSGTNIEPWEEPNKDLVNCEQSSVKEKMPDSLQTYLQNVSDVEIEQSTKCKDNYSENDFKVVSKIQTNKEKVLQSYKNYLENINAFTGIGVCACTNSEVLQSQRNNQSVQTRSQREPNESLNDMKENEDETIGLEKIERKFLSDFKNPPNLQQDDEFNLQEDDQKCKENENSITEIEEKSSKERTVRENPQLPQIMAAHHSGTRVVVHPTPKNYSTSFETDLKTSNSMQTANGIVSPVKENLHQQDAADNLLDKEAETNLSTKEIDPLNKPNESMNCSDCQKKVHKDNCSLENEKELQTFSQNVANCSEDNCAEISYQKGREALEKVYCGEIQVPTKGRNDEKALMFQFEDAKHTVISSKVPNQNQDQRLLENKLSKFNEDRFNCDGFPKDISLVMEPQQSNGCQRFIGSKSLPDDNDAELKIGTPRSFVENVTFDSENGSHVHIEYIFPDQRKLTHPGNVEKPSATSLANFENKANENGKRNQFQNKLESLAKDTNLGNNETDQDFKMPCLPISSEYMKSTWFIGAEPIVTSSGDKTNITPQQLVNEPIANSKGTNLEETNLETKLKLNYNVLMYNLSESYKLAIQNIVPMHENRSENFETNEQGNKQSAVRQSDFSDRCHADDEDFKFHEQDENEQLLTKATNTLDHNCFQRELFIVLESNDSSGQDNAEKYENNVVCRGNSNEREGRNNKNNESSIWGELNRGTTGVYKSRNFCGKEAVRTTQKGLSSFENAQEVTRKHDTDISTSSIHEAQNIYENAAIKIQTKYRKYKINLQMTAAYKIQRIFREYKSRKNKFICEPKSEDLNSLQEIPCTRNKSSIKILPHNESVAPDRNGSSNIEKGSAAKLAKIKFEKVEQSKSAKQRKEILEDSVNLDGELSANTSKGSIIAEVSSCEEVEAKKIHVHTNATKSNYMKNSKQDRTNDGSTNFLNDGSTNFLKQNKEPSEGKESETISGKLRLHSPIELLSMHENFHSNRNLETGILQVPQSLKNGEEIEVSNLMQYNQEVEENRGIEAPTNISNPQLPTNLYDYCEPSDPRIDTEVNDITEYEDGLKIFTNIHKSVCPVQVGAETSNYKELDHQSNAPNGYVKQDPRNHALTATTGMNSSFQNNNSESLACMKESTNENFIQHLERLDNDFVCKTQSETPKSNNKAEFLRIELIKYLPNGNSLVQDNENILQNGASGKEEHKARRFLRKIINAAENREDEPNKYSELSGVCVADRLPEIQDKDYKQVKYQQFIKTNDDNEFKNFESVIPEKIPNDELSGFIPVYNWEEQSTAAAKIQRSYRSYTLRISERNLKNRWDGNSEKKEKTAALENLSLSRYSEENSPSLETVAKNDISQPFDDRRKYAAATMIQRTFKDFVFKKRLLRSCSHSSNEEKSVNHFENAAKEKDFGRILDINSKPFEATQTKPQIDDPYCKCVQEIQGTDKSNDVLTNAAVLIQQSFRSFQARKLDLQGTTIDKQLDYYAEKEECVAGLQVGGNKNVRDCENVEEIQERVPQNIDNHSIKLEKQDKEKTNKLTNEETTSKDSFSDEDALNTIIDVRVEPKSLFQAYKDRSCSSDMTHVHDYRSSSENISNEGSNGSYQHLILLTAESLIARRMTLQRGDAVQENSNPEEDKSYDENMLISSNQKTNLARTNVKFRFGPRQRTMPVQIDSDVMRVIPKHLQKRIRSAEDSRRKTIQQIRK